MTRAPGRLSTDDGEELAAMVVQGGLRAPPHDLDRDQFENLPKLAIVWLRLRGLTLEQFLEVMHKGTDFKNRHPEISPLLQIMPWPVFGNMSDRELQAVYEFLRAIPCVGSSERCGS